jgi:hypothetical protein
MNSLAQRPSVSTTRLAIVLSVLVLRTPLGYDQCRNVLTPPIGNGYINIKSLVCALSAPQRLRWRLVCSKHECCPGLTALTIHCCMIIEQGVQILPIVIDQG